MGPARDTYTVSAAVGKAAQRTMTPVEMVLEDGVVRRVPMSEPPPETWLERVGEVRQSPEWEAARSLDRDDIEAAGDMPQIEPAEIRRCCMHEMILLLPGHGGCGTAEQLARTSLDLDKDDLVTPAHHEIELASPPTPVAVTEVEPFEPEEPQRGALTTASGTPGAARAHGVSRPPGVRLKAPGARLFRSFAGVGIASFLQYERPDGPALLQVLDLEPRQR